MKNADTEPLVVTIDPEVLTVKADETAQFKCTASGGDGQARVRWAFGDDDGPLRGDVTESSGYLTIRKVDQDHEGEYVCVAEDDAGHKATGTATLYVNREQPPTVRMTPPTQTVRAGEPFKLRCEADGHPPARLEISNTKGKVWTPVNGELTIDAAERTHTDEYTCTATNAVGQAEARATVVVESPSWVEITPSKDKVYISEGQPLLLTCQGHGDPKPEIKWIR